MDVERYVTSYMYVCHVVVRRSTEVNVTSPNSLELRFHSGPDRMAREWRCRTHRKPTKQAICNVLSAFRPHHAMLHTLCEGGVVRSEVESTATFGVNSDGKSQTLSVLISALSLS